MATKRGFSDGGRAEKLWAERVQEGKKQKLEAKAAKERQSALYSDNSDKALSSEGAKKRGASLAKQMEQTNFGKFLDRNIAEADKVVARDKLRRSDDPSALARADRVSSELKNENDAARKRLLDSMDSYKKGGRVKARGDGLAQRGKTKGRFV